MTFIVLNIIPFMRYLSSLFLFFLLVSCRSLDPATTDTYHSSLIVRNSHDTLIMRDSVHTHDSIFTSERQRGDTIYRERIVYRDRVAYRDRWRTQIVHDTIIHTDSIVQVIEHPSERYVPKFYKWTAAIFWTGIALLLLYLILKGHFYKLPVFRS